MVDGINGTTGSTQTNSAELVEAFKQALTEVLEEKEAAGAKFEQTQDEEAVVETVGDSIGEKPQQTAETSVLTALLTSLTTMMSTMMNAFLEAIGLNKTDKTQDTEKTEQTEKPQEGNQTYTMSADEKAYLTLHPNFVKELVAEQKFNENPKDYKDYRFYAGRQKIRSNKQIISIIAKRVTDDEVQAYLQLHPNVIKDAIVNGK